MDDTKLDDRKRYMLAIYRLALIAFLILTVTFTTCTMDKRHVMAQMVSDGAEPMNAMCAVYAGELISHECSIYVARDLLKGENK